MMMTTQPCPECENSKHQNCHGRTWDWTLDQEVICPCYRVGHDTSQWREPYE